MLAENDRGVPRSKSSMVMLKRSASSSASSESMVLSPVTGLECEEFEEEEKQEEAGEGGETSSQGEPGCPRSAWMNWCDSWYWRCC